MSRRNFVPYELPSGHILAATYRGLLRCLIRCGGCKEERWAHVVDPAVLTGLCRSCAPSLRQSGPRLSKGQRVGNFEVVLATSARQKKGNGGTQYLVRDLRCRHEKLVWDSRGGPFKGLISLCGCPVRVYAHSYVRWEWRAQNGKWISIPEHRIVMEGLIGRELLPHENVHHINGMRDDNRPENLELWSSSQPSGQRVADKVAWAEELLLLYAPEKLA